ncbi:MAG: hypothetical protein RIR26_1812 [Pseudomonadota bacterium]|jgi:peptidoglycan/xylan/chitin deacetylase (PgdA/CDA1 family)
MRLKKPALIVLCYHGISEREESRSDDFCFVSEEKFNTDLSIIRSMSGVIFPLNEGLQKLSDSVLPLNSVAITFDDGFASVFKRGGPILNAHQAHATVFLPRRPICQETQFWFSELLHSLEQTKKSSFRLFGHTLDISAPERKQKVSTLLQRFFKTLHPAAVPSHIEELRKNLDTADRPLSDKYRLATEDECVRALKSGRFHFGAHSSSHTIHTLLSQKELEIEITESVNWVSALIGEKCTLYAYPNGGPQDFSTRCHTLLRNAGVTHALTTIPDAAQAEVHPLAIPRYCVGPKTNVADILNRRGIQLRNLFFKALSR